MIGALVQVRRYVGCRRADQLGALEGRREGAVNVDHAALDPLAYLGGEDLHLAGGHDQLGVRLVDDRYELGLGGRLGVGRHASFPRRRGSNQAYRKSLIVGTTTETRPRR